MICKSDVQDARVKGDWVYIQGQAAWREVGLGSHFTEEGFLSTNMNEQEQDCE